MPSPTERDEALRRAERLLRQGQIDAAIREYLGIIDAAPTDWTTMNVLGDLFVRLGASDRALPLFLRIADGYLAEGFYAKAAAFYKKVLKFTPDDEATILKLAKTSAFQGLKAEARAQLWKVARARQARGDASGAAVVMCGIDDLDPVDAAARVAAIRALAPIDPAAALERFHRVARDLEGRERRSEAQATWEEAHRLAPSDPVARIHVAASRAASGDLDGAAALVPSWEEASATGEKPAWVAAQLAIASARVTRGDFAAALAIARHVSARAPGDPRIAEVVASAEAVEAAARARASKEEDARRATPTPTPHAPEAAPEEEELLEADDEELIDEDEELDEPEVEGIEILEVSAATGDADEPSAVADFEAAEASAEADRVAIVVDLTDKLNELAAAAPPLSFVGPPRGTAEGAPTSDIEAAFAEMRRDAADSVEDPIAVARTFLSAGLQDDAIRALESAARDPGHRYDAAILLVQIYESRDDVPAAVEWLERAADSAPGEAKRGASLYRLATLLESMGEPARALAVLLELQSMAPGFRDVAGRVARLERAIGGGASTP